MAERVARLTAVLLALCLVVSAGAEAQQCTGSSDVAAIDQYCERLPGLDATPQDPDARIEEVLPPEQVAELRAAGALGEAILMLPAQTPGADAVDGPLPGADDLLGAGRLGAGGDDGGSAGADAFDAIQGVVGGAGSPGFLQWGLVITTLGLVAVAWLRPRGWSLR